jgi:hypothetical protein
VLVLILTQKKNTNEKMRCVGFLLSKRPLSTLQFHKHFFFLNQRKMTTIKSNSVAKPKITFVSANPHKLNEVKQILEGEFIIEGSSIDRMYKLLNFIFFFV